jgi:hypothetical protein
MKLHSKCAEKMYKNNRNECGRCENTPVSSVVSAGLLAQFFRTPELQSLVVVSSNQRHLNEGVFGYTERVEKVEFSFTGAKQPSRLGVMPGEKIHSFRV